MTEIENQLGQSKNYKEKGKLWKLLNKRRFKEVFEVSPDDESAP